MKYCEKCGKQLNDDAVFCEGCGVRVAEPITEIIKENSSVNIDNTISLVENSYVKYPVKNLLLMCIIAIVSIVLIIVFAPNRSTFELDGVTYEYGWYGVDLSVIAINPQNDDLSINNIPVSIDGIPIEIINCDASNGMTSTVESIVLPNSTILYVHSFSNCKNLKSVELSANEISGYVFSDCTSLKEVKLYGDVGMEGLKECSSLEKITIIGGDWVYIPSDCFKSFYSLKSITIEANDIDISEGAFKYCTALENVTLQANGSISFPKECFYSCSSLKTMTFYSYASIFENAFENCSSLEKLIFKDGCTVFEYAFKGCNVLKKFSVPNDMEEMEIKYLMRDIIVGSKLFSNVSADLYWELAFLE